MAADITPDDLVKLAEYCGKEVRPHPNLPHLVLRDGGGIWQPHLPAGAVQRDEVEDAVIANGGHWRSHSLHDGRFRNSIMKQSVASSYWLSVARATEATRGEAVCLAALQVIG